MLLKNIDIIYRFQLLGGEPLLNKDFYKMVEYASTKKQIKYVITITNGTIIPDEKLLKIYSKYKNKNIIEISDYTSNTELKNLKFEKVVDLFKNNGNYIRIVNDEWMLRGEIKKENRTINELKKEFMNCWQQYCPSYCDGELHSCSRSVAIKRTLDKSINDFILIDNDVSRDIIYFFIRDYIKACDYCHTNMNRHVPRGLQIKNNEKY